MHARDLVELAALAAVHGPVLIKSGARVSATGIEQYWSTSRCRLERWSRSLKSFSTLLHQDRAEADRQWPATRPLVEEILVSEMLTRVWGTVLAAADLEHASQDAGPVAQSVMLGHLEARHRALGLMLYGPGGDADDALALNRLRRRTERWTDVLVGSLLVDWNVPEFAVDCERAKEFADDLSHQRRLSSGRTAWAITLTSLRGAFHQGLSGGPSPNADLNGKIASAVLASFPPDVFDATGVFRSLWELRLANTTADVQVLVDELLCLSESARHERTAVRSEDLRRNRLN